MTSGRLGAGGTTDVLRNVHHEVTLYILEHVVWSGIWIFGMYRMSITKVKNEAYLGEEVHTYQNRNQHPFMKPGLSVVLWIG